VVTLIHKGPKALIAEANALIVGRKMAFYVYGRIDYKDAFGENNDLPNIAIFIPESSRPPPVISLLIKKATKQTKANSHRAPHGARFYNLRLHGWPLLKGRMA
jgi:hypothetical protein